MINIEKPSDIDQIQTEHKVIHDNLIALNKTISDRLNYNDILASLIELKESTFYHLKNEDEIIKALVTELEEKTKLALDSNIRQLLDEHLA